MTFLTVFTPLNNEINRRQVQQNDRKLPNDGLIKSGRKIRTNKAPIVLVRMTPDKIFDNHQFVSL